MQGDTLEKVAGRNVGDECESCAGSGEMPSEFGSVDCPDCGGEGRLPPRAVLVEWRAKDIARAVEKGHTATAKDVRWLLTELLGARAALKEILSLAQELETSDAHATRIRFTANRALNLYPVESDASFTSR